MVVAVTVFKGGYYYKGDDIHVRIITCWPLSDCRIRPNLLVRKLEISYEPESKS